MWQQLTASWNFTPQALFPLCGLVCTSALGLVVAVKRKGTFLSRSFLALNAAAVLWNLDVVLLFTVGDLSVASALDRALQIPIVSIPFLGLLFVFAYLGRKASHPLLIVFGLWTAVLWSLSPTPFFISSWEKHWFGFYGKAGVLYLLFPLTHAAYLAVSCRLLWRERRAAGDRLRRTQVSWLLAANVLLGLGSVDNFLPLYGGGRLPLGNLAVVPYTFVIATTIVRHRLLGFDVLFRYGLLYSILTTLISGVYLLFALVLQGWFRVELFGEYPLLATLPVLAVAFAFVPLKNSLQESIDRRFFRSRVLLRSRLADFPRAVSCLGSEEEVWRTAWEQRWSAVEAEKGVVLAARGGKLFPVHRDGADPSPAPVAPVEGPAAGSARFLSGEFELEVPVLGREGLLGCCLLGRKRKGGIYSLEEIAYLRCIAGQTALAVERARLLKEGHRREHLAALGKAAAVLSHEVRNPLNVIRGAMAVLRSDLSGERAEGLLRIVEEEVQRGDRVIEDFLAACRDPRPVLHPLDLKEFLGSVASDAVSRGGQVHLDLPGSALNLRADHFQLRRVFENLLRNSAEAAGEGGTVTIRCLHPENGEMRLSIGDDGPGIDEEILPLLFEPFQTTKRHGTGLGLAIAKAIVEAHGGTIEAENAERGGALFLISLPAPLTGQRQEGALRQKAAGS